MSYQCKVCACRDQPGRHRAREMMFGLREPFEYLECPACRSLQIAEIPTDLGRHYPPAYYSMSQPCRLPTGLQALLKRARGRYCLTGRGLLGRWVAATTVRPRYFQWLRRAGVGFDDAILEIGCGRGEFLTRLAADGFRSLAGVDPFVDAEVTYPNGMTVYKRQVGEMPGMYDLVLSQHSIEHVPDPLATLRDVARLLKPGRTFLVATPVANTYGWRTYGTDWVQLDPPRHLVIFSPEGLRLAAERTGFELYHVEYDAKDLLFFGSEQYRRDIPLTDPRSHWLGGAGEIFSKEEMAGFAARAESLNAANDGDQAVFFLRKA